MAFLIDDMPLPRGKISTEKMDLRIFKKMPPGRLEAIEIVS
jgi:hypothetical protein